MIISCIFAAACKTDSIKPLSDYNAGFSGITTVNAKVETTKYIDGEKELDVTTVFDGRKLYAVINFVYGRKDIMYIDGTDLYYKKGGGDWNIYYEPNGFSDDLAIIRAFLDESLYDKTEKAAEHLYVSKDQAVLPDYDGNKALGAKITINKDFLFLEFTGIEDSLDFIITMKITLGGQKVIIPEEIL